MNEQPRIALLLGTAREGRMSEQVARYVEQVLSAQNLCALDFFDVRDLATSYTNRINDTGWKQVAGLADGFVFVVPEYNHGYPGEFKIVIDQANKEYGNKPTLLCTVSAGDFGGVRLAENVLPVFDVLRLFVIPERIHVTRVVETFAPGNEALVAEKYKTKIEKAGQSLAFYAKHFKNMRAELNVTI